MREVCFEKHSAGPLRGAGGESSSEFRDSPLGTGLSREPPFPDPPSPPSGGLNAPPPPPPVQANVPHAMVGSGWSLLFPVPTCWHILKWKEMFGRKEDFPICQHPFCPPLHFPLRVHWMQWPHGRAEPGRVVTSNSVKTAACIDLRKWW